MHRHQQILPFSLRRLARFGAEACVILLLCSSQSLAKVRKKSSDDVGKRDVGRGVNFYSLEKEIGLGKQMAQEVERDSQVLRDPVVAEYVNRLGQNLVRNSDARVPFTIKVLDSEDVNAFALPGGFFFVNTGLILATDTEAELAGAMAHEIAHVAARHGTRQATRGTIANYASLPLIFLGGWVGLAIQQAAAFAIPMGFLRFSRSFESEADILGLGYMYKAGYDPTAFVDFFERIQTVEKTNPGLVSKVFSTHPPTGARIRAAQNSIQSLLRVKSEDIVTTSEFIDVKQRLYQLENGKKPDIGDLNRPHLRRAAGTPVPAENGSRQSNSGEDGPTLKRRPGQFRPYGH